MNQMGRRFGLCNAPERGVYCGENGVFVDGVPLLERSPARQWEPRSLRDLNRELGERYGLPVNCSAKIAGLAAVARALDRGDLLHAQIATLHLQIPDPPASAKSVPTPGDIVDLARALQASGLLKADWDPLKHPRWPAGSPGGIGGEFSPTGTASGDFVAEELNAPVIPAQITLPAPLEFPVPGAIPFPSEIVPAPVIPDVYPRSQLRNPYPDRPECEEEWAHALEYCKKLMMSGRMGTDGTRGFGRTFQQCVLGMVREDCGGSMKS